MTDFPILSGETFVARLADFDAGLADFRGRFDRLRRACDAAIRAEFKRQFPRRRYNPGHLPNLGEVMAGWRVAADCEYQIRSAYESSAQEELRIAANRDPLPLLAHRFDPEAVQPAPAVDYDGCPAIGSIDPDGLRLVDSVNAHSFSSQGWGAQKYARGRAQTIADNAEHHGLTVKIRVILQKPQRNIAEFGIFANTTETGWRQLQYRDPLALREIIRRCWKRGVNPRVYFHFLPHGYEEHMGLDFFGGEFEPAAAVSELAL